MVQVMRFYSDFFKDLSTTYVFVVIFFRSRSYFQIPPVMKGLMGNL